MFIFYMVSREDENTPPVHFQRYVGTGGGVLQDKFVLIVGFAEVVFSLK